MVLKGWVQASYTLAISRNGQEETFNVTSSESVLVPWPTLPLPSREVVHVKVCAAGRDGSRTNWAPLVIEAALLERSGWVARLISGPVQARDEPKRPFRVRKSFYCPKGGSARLYATAHGIYQVEINGRVVGGQLLAPGWQSYKHRLHYQTYDISSYLVDGENVVGAYIAEGWYAGRLGRPGVSNIWGDRLSFLGQLEVDGQVVCATESSWEWLGGPILGAEIYNGEIFDSALDDPSPTSSASPKGPVEDVGFPSAELIAPDAVPVRRVMEIESIELIITPKGKKVLDFGQNLVGWLKILVDIPGKSGDTVVVRHAEVLEIENSQGREYRSPWRKDKGLRIKILMVRLQAIVISSDLRRTGTFTCSHASINQLHQNTRDERLGWTGDIQVFAPTASYLFDTAAFLGEWLQDLEGDQREMGGVVPVIVPKIPIPPRHPESRPMAVWADCSVITPWDLYNSSGDRAILERQWESMRLWLEHGVPRNEQGFYAGTTPQYGDWLDPRSPPQLPGHSPTGPFLIANAYLIHAEEMTEKFRAEYVTKTGRLACDTQAAYALALLFDLFGTEEQAQTARARLDWVVRWEAFEITTRFAGTPVILQVLADHGMLGHAYRMLQERDCPSWLYPVGMGATTIWERWNSMLPDSAINPGQMTSFNHYALGSVCNFLHRTVGGLSPASPGWKAALVSPRPGGTIRHAHTSFDSPYGPYSVTWKIEGSRMITNVTVPPNGEARVVLSGVDEKVGSGEYTFETAWEEDPDWPPAPIQGAQGNEVPAYFVP
ncbi:hypothetical protein INS49_015321 [Diaporthe citri]|uniref:uncharacterized protein n=1 Tax=Diaporthe citri TaxID=83186 RepID=UPI001C7FB54F|nr:uncharacterized protein INS49_015321 [Diaporthe citri]KAG6355937.1 hypothetical protein INS49_015321 [Diaporthe citri]